MSSTTCDAEVAAEGAVPGAPVLPEKLGALIGHLAEGERVEEALDLARVLLAVLQASDLP